MAMSVTISDRTRKGITVVKFDWTSAADGTATNSTTKLHSGKVLELATDPGSTAPSADYDITITDSDGLDVLAGQGADRHTSNTEYVIDSDSNPLGVVADSTLTINVSNAGDSKVGVAYLYLQATRW